MVARAVIHGVEHARARGKAEEEADEQVYQHASGADGGKRGIAAEVADDGAVY